MNRRGALKQRIAVLAPWTSMFVSGEMGGRLCRHTLLKILRR